MRAFSNEIELIPLDRYNWESVIALEVRDDQKNFMHSNLFLLAQCRFENLNPFAVTKKGDMVGLITYGEFNGICWINHIMVDRNSQQLGIGNKALQLMIDTLKGNWHCKEIRTTVSKENFWALYFFEQAGFEVIKDDLGGEVILKYKEKKHEY